jgi:hypothetical protein
MSNEYITRLSLLGILCPLLFWPAYQPFIGSDIAVLLALTIWGISLLILLFNAFLCAVPRFEQRILPILLCLVLAFVIEVFSYYVLQQTVWAAIIAVVLVSAIWIAFFFIYKREGFLWLSICFLLLALTSTPIFLEIRDVRIPAASMLQESQLYRFLFIAIFSIVVFYCLAQNQSEKDTISITVMVAAYSFHSPLAKYLCRPLTEDERLLGDYWNGDSTMGYFMLLGVSFIPLFLCYLLFETRMLWLRRSSRETELE